MDARAQWTQKRPDFAADILELKAAIMDALAEPAASRFFAIFRKMIQDVTVLYNDSTNDLVPVTVPDARHRLLLLSIDFMPVSGYKSRTFQKVSNKRGAAMHQAAESSSNVKGVWKVGDAHIHQINDLRVATQYEVLDQQEFEDGFQSWRKWRWLGL